MSKIPPRTVVDAYFAHMSAMGVQRQLDVSFDVDLGELVDGHHVVVRGIEHRPGEAVLHYELVPAVQEHECQEKGPFLCVWGVSASDDAGTEYDGHNTGGFDLSGRGPSSHGSIDLGGAISAAARRLVLDFEPPWHYTPPAVVCRRLTIELATGAVTAVRA